MVAGIKILIVDDFEMFRNLLKNALTDMGYTNIVEAENGFDALSKIAEAKIKRDPFAIVFCDWNMPEVSGLQVLESCRKQGEAIDLPFVMVTAESDQTQVVRAIKAGATDYIVKPISEANLKLKIERIFKSQKLKAAA